MLKSKVSKGFTLIEMLLVVVIIGILVAVVIVIVNPTAQRNRASNATIRSALVKAGFAGVATLNASDTAIPAAPTDVEFYASLSNKTDGNADCADSDSTCTFGINGLDLPNNCGLTLYDGTGANQCEFFYTRYTVVDTNDQFTIEVRRHPIGTEDPLLVGYLYDSATGAVSDL